MFSLILLLSCTGKTTDTEETYSVIADTPCDPLDSSLCGFPFPSSLYQRVDSSAVTGYRLDFPTGVLPNVNNRAADPALWNERDGFSPLTPILTHFPDVVLDGVIGHQNLEDYLAEDAKTVLWDVDSGTRIPHFVELDMRHEDDTRRALMLRPVEPIPWGHRVVVGIRGLTDTSGTIIQPSIAFADLRDSTTDSGYDLIDRQAHFDDVVFPELERARFPRAELQLAWDFVVASKEGTTQKLLHMRDDALERHQNGETSYFILESFQYTEEEDPRVAKKIYGSMRVPYYTEESEPGHLLTRDDNGMPVSLGARDIPFTLIVPHSVWNSTEPSPIMQYGHGLLGSQDEVEGEAVTTVANTYGALVLATDWSGLCARDLNAVSQMMVNDIDRFAIVPERSQQGFIEAYLALQIVQDQMVFDDSLMSAQGVSVVDPEHAVFYGNSMGAIFGLPYVAMNPEFERAVLGVPGASFSLLLPRSLNFGSFYGLLQNLYADPLEIVMWLGLIQSLWDSAEPSGYLDSISLDPLPGNVEKQVLAQAGIGDAQVHTLGAHIMMRGIGGGVIASPTRSVWGLGELENAATGSGLVEWDYGMPEPVENVPPIRYENFDVHRAVREEVQAQQQIVHFFHTGELYNFCEGPCISEDGVDLD